MDNNTYHRKDYEISHPRNLVVFEFRFMCGVLNAICPLGVKPLLSGGPVLVGSGFDGLRN